MSFTNNLVFLLILIFFALFYTVFNEKLFSFNIKYPRAKDYFIALYSALFYALWYPPAIALLIYYTFIPYPTAVFLSIFYKPLGFDIMNLGEDLTTYPKMQLEGSCHAANSGSFVKSIVFGKKLQEYLNKQR